MFNAVIAALILSPKSADALLAAFDDGGQGMYSASGQPLESDGRTIVAIVLMWKGRICLLKRSAEVNHDATLWHCVTGYVEVGRQVESQAFQEIFEETGVVAADLSRFDLGPILELEDARGDGWRVHTFRAEVLHKRLRLNWEHDEYRWVVPHKVRGFQQVDWFHHVLEALGSA